MARFQQSGKLQQSGQSLGALAAALLLAGSNTLPALAALPQTERIQTGPILAMPMRAMEDGLLVAESEKDDKKKKKKQQQQAQPHKQSDHKTSDPAKNKKNNYPGSNTKSNSKQRPEQSTKDKQPSKNKVSDKQREKIYQEGREDGLQKGRNKGYDKGYDKGFDAGKQKGKDKGYRKAQRQEWQSWNSNQWKQYNKSRRNIWITPVQYNRPFYGNPGWAQSPNWGYNRPWGGGWYNSSSPSWSWWGGQALGWGINALTTALIVNNAVNRAIRERQTTVVVPNSSMQLYYGSVEARDQTEVTFVVTNGNYTYEMEADCEDGLLNGEVPTSLAEAELVNTACQVAFGTI